MRSLRILACWDIMPCPLINITVTGLREQPISYLRRLVRLFSHFAKFEDYTACN